MDLIYSSLGAKEGDITVINMNDFLRLLDASVVTAESSGRLSASITSQSEVSLVLESLRNRIQTSAHDAPLTSTGSKKVSLVRVENALEDACIGNPRDKKFNISKSAFSKALDSVNIHIRAADVDSLFNTYSTDKRRKDTINYPDFIEALSSIGSARSPRESITRSPRESSSTPRRRTTSPPVSSPVSRKNDRK